MTDLTPTEAVEDFMAKLEAGYAQVEHLIVAYIKSDNHDKKACCVLGCWMLGHGTAYEWLPSDTPSVQEYFDDTYPALSDYILPISSGNDAISVLEFIWQTSDSELIALAGYKAQQAGIDKRRAYDRVVIDRIGFGLRGLVTDE